MKPDTEKVLSILAVHENNAANLIAILQDVQAEYNYLSEANRRSSLIRWISAYPASTA